MVTKQDEVLYLLQKKGPADQSPVFQHSQDLEELEKPELPSFC
jgi:hypothetical protein